MLDPAQRQASEAGLSRVLVDIVSGERLSSCLSSLTHMMTILELLCNQGMPSAFPQRREEYCMSDQGTRS